MFFNCKMLLYFIAFLQVITLANCSKLYQRDSDFVLQYHACFTTQLGFDVIKNSVNAIFTEYIDRYNSDRSSSFRKINTSENSKLNGKAYKVERSDDIKMEIKTNGIDFTVPYTAESNGDQLSGDFQISLNVVHPEPTDYIQQPRLELSLGKSSALAPLIFTFEDGYHFDQPSATRMLTGFIRALNDYTSD